MILSASDTAVESFKFLLGKFQLKNSVIDHFKGFTQNNIQKKTSDFDQKGQNMIILPFLVIKTLHNTVFVKIHVF